MKKRLRIKEFKDPTYSKDNRLPITKIYSSYSKLKKTRWKKTRILRRNIVINKRKIKLPIFAFRTKKKGKALWLIAGVHGEEPAGPNAIAKNINYLNKISKQIPIVLFPLTNPAGYIRNWRYPYLKKYKKNKTSISVGDSEHYLIDANNSEKPRKDKPSCKESEKITKYALKYSKKYPPVLVLDFHEDLSQGNAYVYSQGILGTSDPVAKEIVKILKKRKFRICEKGTTRFGQQIVNGVVSNINDGSIDELLASKKIIVNKKIKTGPFAKSVLVIETNIVKMPLKKRVKAHSQIIRSARKFFNIAKKIRVNTNREEEIV